MLKRFVELIVQVSEPQLALVWRPGLSRLLNDLSNLIEVLLPEILILEEINVHELNDHIYNVDMNFPEASIF